MKRTICALKLSTDAAWQALGFTLAQQRTATADEVKATYREFAKRYHPDATFHASEEDRRSAVAKFANATDSRDLLLVHLEERNKPAAPFGWEKAGGSFTHEAGSPGGSRSRPSKFDMPELQSLLRKRGVGFSHQNMPPPPPDGEGSQRRAPQRAPKAQGHSAGNSYPPPPPPPSPPPPPPKTYPEGSPIETSDVEASDDDDVEPHVSKEVQNMRKGIRDWHEVQKLQGLSSAHLGRETLR
ncbi:hypothetical protein DIPPA_00519 [Diplonema papillatum]|nr:hypothetical protein DIPPA_00519 [Diplonema papillatum]